MDTGDIAYHNFASRIRMATPGQMEQAARWYHDAEGVAREVAHNVRRPLSHGAAVVSAFSPRERWASNVTKAIHFSLGGIPAGLSRNVHTANLAVVYGIPALTGPKTNAFARAIAGDDDATVIDVWMMRAAGLDKDTPTKREYAALSSALIDAASDFGITPRTAQAAIWIVERGNHA
jgi:hypothetical protein